MEQSLLFKVPGLHCFIAAGNFTFPAVSFMTGRCCSAVQVCDATAVEKMYKGRVQNFTLCTKNQEQLCCQHPGILTSTTLR